MVSRTGEHIPASTLLTGYLCFIWEVPIAFFSPPKKIYTLLILFLISFFRLSLMREKQLASPLSPLTFLFLLHIAQLNSHKREDNFLIRNEQFFFSLLLLTLRSVVFWILAIFNSFALHWVSQRLWFSRISYVKLKFVSVAAINYAGKRSKCLFSSFNALCLQISIFFSLSPPFTCFVRAETSFAVSDQKQEKSSLL